MSKCTHRAPAPDNVPGRVSDRAPVGARDHMRADAGMDAFVDAPPQMPANAAADIPAPVPADAPAGRPPSRPKKPQTQVAALCLNETRDRVLLITSRGTGRWIVPKGWPMRKLSLPRTALQEAWEEAGVEGTAGQTEIGCYHYDKGQDHGLAIPVEVRVFPVIVTRLKSRYPEAGERRRQWFAPADAAPLVAEEGLRVLILSLPQLVAAGRLPAMTCKRRK